jgi:hypothetical protein
MSGLSEHLSRLARIVVFASSGLLLGITSVAAQEPDARAPPPDSIIRSSTTDAVFIGTRIRITGAAALADGLRLSGEPETTGGALAEIRDGREVPGSVAVGRDAVLLRAGQRMVGDLSALTPLSLTVTLIDGRSVTVPYTAVARYERADGRRSRKRGALLGLLVGGIGGALIGLKHGQGCEPVHNGGLFANNRCLGEPGASALGGFVIGAGGGAVVGALLPRRQRWKTLSVPALDGGDLGVAGER